MIKAIHFLGTLIIGLANLIKFLSNILKLSVFFSFIMGMLLGVVVGIFDLIFSDCNFYGHIAWDIVAVVIGAGLLYLIWNKTRILDREYQKKLDDLRNYDC